MSDPIRERFLRHAEILRNDQDSTIIRWINWVFTIGNIVLGYGLWQIRTTNSLLTTKAHLTLRFWAVVFIVIGAAMAYSLIARKIRTLRYSIGAALLVKFTWMIALLIAVAVSGISLLPITAIWWMILSIQFIIFIHLPKEKRDGISN